MTDRLSATSNFFIVGRNETRLNQAPLEVSIGPRPLNRIPCSRPSWLRPKYLLFAAIGLMVLLVAVVFERLLVDYHDPEWKHIQPFKWWLLVHRIAGASPLMLGPMQFSDRLRQRFAKLHRVVGRIYVT